MISFYLFKNSDLRLALWLQMTWVATFMDETIMKKLLLTSALLMSSFTWAQTSSCEVTLRHDLRFTPELTELSSGAQTVWSLDATGQFMIDGKVEPVTAEQHALLVSYREGLVAQAENTMAIVTDAMTFSLETTSRVMSEISGIDLTEKPAYKALASEVQNRINSLIVREDNVLEIRGSEFEAVTEGVENDIENLVQELVSDSLFSVLWKMSWQFFKQGADLEASMERLTADIEQEAHARANKLEKEGVLLCEQIQNLDAVETELQQHFPKLKQYDLVNAHAFKKGTVLVI